MNSSAKFLREYLFRAMVVALLLPTVMGVANAQGTTASCPVVAQPVYAGGCRITLTTGTNCQTLSSSTGYFEFAWTTSGTFCESPMNILIAGSPANTWLYGNNYVLYTVSTGTGAGYWSWVDRSIGGYVHLTANDLARISSDNGQYYWGVQSYYGSSSGTGTFYLQGLSGTTPSSSSSNNNQRADCLFAWAERTYSQLFSPAGTASATYAPYYYRYYGATANYLALSSTDSHIWVYGPSFGNQLLDVGLMTSLLATAGCS